MATVVNNPAPATTDSGMGFLLGVILLVVVGILFFIYAVPYIGSTMRAPQVNVPSTFDVNVNTPNK